MQVPVQERGIEWYQTPSGEKRYRVRWREGKKNCSRSFSRLADARKFYLEARTASETGKRLAPAATQDLTLAEFVLNTWAPKAERRLASKTWKTDKIIYNKHILPTLGSRPIAELDAEDLVEFQDDLEEKDVGAPTQLKIFGILSSIFKEAARRPRSTGVKTNPVALLEKPSAKRRKKVKVFSPEVVEGVRKQLFEGIRRPDPDREKYAIRDSCLVSIAYMTGMRPGEILALKVENIKSKDIHVAAAVSDSVLVDQTKTGKDRLVPIRKALRNDLNALIASWNLQPGDLLFSRTDGSNWSESDWKNWRIRHFNAALEKTGNKDLIGVRPYELGRHSHSALMLASGISLVSLADIQGHSVRILSETYSSVIADYRDKPAINPDQEIENARKKVFRSLDPSTGL